MTDYTELVKALRDIEKTMFALGTSPINMGDVSISLAYDKRWGQTAEAAAAAIEALNRLLDQNTQRCEALRKQLREAHESYERHLNELEAQLPKRGDIVRCGECKWYQPDLCANPWGVCFHEDWVENNIGHTVDEDGFCYRGEREVQE